jgi:hypothetical protein
VPGGCCRCIEGRADGSRQHDEQKSSHGTPFLLFANCGAHSRDARGDDHICSASAGTSTGPHPRICVSDGPKRR